MQDRPRANVLRASSGDIGQSTARRLHCTQKAYYVPSQLQRRGISYAESKTECQPTKHLNCTVRNYLTAREIEKLMDYVRKHSRYGHRDATMILVTYRHGLRASEVFQ